MYWGYSFIILGNREKAQFREQSTQPAAPRVRPELPLCKYSPGLPATHLLRIFSACCSEILTPRSRRDCMISWASMRPAATRSVSRARHVQKPRRGQAGQALQFKLTIVLLVQTLEHQPQLLLMVLKVVHKLFKVQLPIEVLVTSLNNFLKNTSEVLCCSLCSLSPSSVPTCHGHRAGLRNLVQTPAQAHPAFLTSSEARGPGGSLRQRSAGLPGTCSFLEFPRVACHTARSAAWCPSSPVPSARPWPHAPGGEVGQVWSQVPSESLQMLFLSPRWHWPKNKPGQRCRDKTHLAETLPGALRLQDRQEPKTNDYSKACADATATQGSQGCLRMRPTPAVPPGTVHLGQLNSWLV